MRTKLLSLILGLAALLAGVIQSHAQGTAFTYQGRLEADGAPYSGLAEMRFSLWDAASGGSQLGSTLTVTPVGVTNGLFTVSLDFGNQFTGANRWLEIALRTNLLGFTTLSPRQPLTATPYAILAGNISGVIANSSLPANPSFSGTVSGGSFSGSGAGLTGLNAGQLTSGTVPDARLGANVARTNQVWLLGGNEGTSPGTHFLGTTDNQSLELLVNNQRALRLEPNTNNAPNVIGGFGGNFVPNTVVGATIGGGGAGNWSGTAYTNRVLGSFGTVGGGVGNTASEWYATVGAGYNNIASGFIATVGGGFANIASAGGATVPGGRDNRAGGIYSFAAGYRARAIHNGAFVWADSQEADFASTGDNQFCLRAAGGVRLNNDTSLSFGNQTRQMINLWNAEYGIGVQSDTTYFRSGNDFAWFRGGSHEDAAGSPGPDGSVLMRLSRDGNLGLGTAPAYVLDVARSQAVGRFTTIFDPNGAVLVLKNVRSSPTYLGAINFENDSATPGQIGYLANDEMAFRVGGVQRMTLNASGLTVNGTFVSSSDRNAKENFETVDPREVLEKVAALPVSRWNYKDDTGARHIGPMAQDFHAAFGVGPDNKHIATVDADGVALAAIQGLNQKVESREQKTEMDITELRAENAALKARLEKLEQLLSQQLNPNGP